MDRREIKVAIVAAMFGVVLTFLGGLLVGQLATNSTIGIAPNTLDVICAVISTLGGSLCISYSHPKTKHV